MKYFKLDPHRTRRGVAFVKVVPERLHIALTDDADRDVALEIDLIATGLKDLDIHTVVLDLLGVQAITARGVRAIVSLYWKLDKANIKLDVWNMSDDVEQKRWDVMQLHSVIPHRAEETLAELVAALEKEAEEQRAAADTQC